VKDRFTVETMVKKYEELYFSLQKTEAESMRCGILRMINSTTN